MEKQHGALSKLVDPATLAHIRLFDDMVASWAESTRQYHDLKAAFDAAAGARAKLAQDKKDAKAQDRKLRKVWADKKATLSRGGKVGC